MTDHVDEVEKLMAEAAGLKDGPAKASILERAVAIADTHQDVKLGYAARKELLPACLDSGQPDLMLVAYSWCLAQCDRDPSQFNLDDILWQYRWVVSEMTSFASISRKQIEDALADISRRYLAAGSTLRPIHLLSMNVHNSLKDRAGATASFERWKGAGRDRYSDDAETERAFVADYYFFMEMYDEAVKMCDAIIKGKMKSEHFFGSDCADLLYPLWKLGRLEDAERCHKKGYRYVAWNPRYVDCCGDHVEYLGLIKDWARAVRLVEKHLPAALAARKPNDRMHFLRACYLWAGRMKRFGHDTVALGLPADFPVKPAGGKYDLAELAAWFKADVAAASAQFDARNGNSYFAEEIAECDANIAAP